MTPLLSSALHLWVLVACASGVFTAFARSTNGRGLSDVLQLIGVTPAVPAYPCGPVEAGWRASWHSPDDAGPGRVPYRLLRRVRLSRPTHAP